MRYILDLTQDVENPNYSAIAYFACDRFRCVAKAVMVNQIVWC